MKSTADITPHTPLRSDRECRLSRFVHSARGATLIELVIGVAISSMIAAATLVAVHQLLVQSRLANDTQLAVSQVRAAEHWMTRDVLSAQTITTGAESGFPVTIEWTAIDGDDVDIVYSLLDMPSGSLKQIERSYSDTGGTSSTLIMAEYIDPALSSCESPSPKVLTVTLAATARTVTETRTFEVTARPDSA